MTQAEVRHGSPIVENMETTDYRVYIGVYIRVMLGLYGDNGKENGNY